MGSPKQGPVPSVCHIRSTQHFPDCVRDDGEGKSRRNQTPLPEKRGKSRESIIMLEFNREA